jgi:small subunit ribosomal protein S21
MGTKALIDPNSNRIMRHLACNRRKQHDSTESAIQMSERETDKSDERVPETRAETKPMEQTETAAPATTPTKRANTAPSRTVEGSPIEVVVDERGVERAIRKLKRKCDTEGVTREIKRRRHYEKPSDRKRRKRRDAERRRRRAARRVARSTRDRR